MSLATNQLRATLRTIDSKAASGSTKLVVARSSTVMSILFRAKHAGETLAAQEEITKIISSYFRRWTHNLQGFPSRLLYAPQATLGLGLPHYPTLVNFAKLNLLHRALYSAPTVRASAQSLLERVMRENINIPASRDFAIPLPLNTSKTARVNFAQSLVEFLHSHNLQLRRGGVQCPTPWQRLIVEFIPSATPAQRQFLNWFGLHTIGDLNQRSATGRLSWVNLEALKHKSVTGAWLTPHFQGPCADGILYFSPGQCWSISSPHTPIPTRVIEILGFTDHTHVSVRHWEFRGHHKRLIAPGDFLWLSTPSIGSGTSVTTLIESLQQPHNTWTQVILSGDKATVRDSQPAVYRTVHHVRFPPGPIIFSPPPRPQLASTLSQLLASTFPEGSTQYSDGAFKQSMNPLSRVFSLTTDKSNLVTTSSAGLVFVSSCSDWHTRPIIVVNIPDIDSLEVDSVNPAEALAIVAIQALLSPTFLAPDIHSDSKFAISHLASSSRPASITNSPAAFATAASRNISVLNPHNLQKVAAHPELRVKDSTQWAGKWTRHEWGNHPVQQQTIYLLFITHISLVLFIASKSSQKTSLTISDPMSTIMWRDKTTPCSSALSNQ